MRRLRVRLSRSFALHTRLISGAWSGQWQSPRHCEVVGGSPTFHLAATTGTQGCCDWPHVGPPALDVTRPKVRATTHAPRVRVGMEWRFGGDAGCTVRTCGGHFAGTGAWPGPTCGRFQGMGLANPIRDCVSLALRAELTCTRGATDATCRYLCSRARRISSRARPASRAGESTNSGCSRPPSSCGGFGVNATRSGSC